MAASPTKSEHSHQNSSVREQVAPGGGRARRVECHQMELHDRFWDDEVMEQGIGHEVCGLRADESFPLHGAFPCWLLAFPEVPRSHTGHLLTCTWWVAAPPRDMSAALCLAGCWSGHGRMSRCHCLALIPQTGCGAFQDQLLNVSSVQVLTLALSSER